MLRSGMPDAPLQVSRISSEALRSQDIAIAATATAPSGVPYIGKERAACEVAIVGAGPHGLATAAHLRAAGVDVRVFGEVMGSWRHNMPAGMVLRSERPGSHIPDPARDLTLEQFEAAIGRQLPRRVPLEDFIAYGIWYQRHAVPEVDQRRVANVDAAGNGFRLTIEDGEPVTAKRVVIATGLEGYEVRPAPFASISRERAPHSYDMQNPRLYAGRRVVVVGQGQSALESAALLREAGAEVEIVLRRPAIKFLSGRDRLRNTLLARLVYPPGEVGPPGLNWIIELPDLFRTMPAGIQQWIVSHLSPIGSAWLRPRLTEVRNTPGRLIVSATELAGRLQLLLDDHSKREVDHVVLGTGYKVDIDRTPVLSSALKASIRRLDGAPDLHSGLESSVTGLHFVGAAAVKSFGPLMRFVAGAGYAARAITRHILAAERRT